MPNIFDQFDSPDTSVAVAPKPVEPPKPPNAFDQFDAPPTGRSLKPPANPFDKFDPGYAQARQQKAMESTWGELDEGEKLALDLSRGGRAAIEGAASTAKGAAIATTIMPVSAGPGAPQSSDLIKLNIERSQRTPQQIRKEIDESGLTKLADKISAYGEKTYPRTQPESVKRPVGAVLEGVGSTVSFLPAGVFGGPAGVVLAGALQNGASSYEEAVKLGADDDKAQTVFFINALGGTTEAIPIARIFRRLDKASGGKVFKAMLAVVKSGFEEGAQEVFQTALNNASATIYDEDRKLLEGALDSGGVGFGTGALLSALGIGTRRVARAASDAVKPKPTGGTDGTQTKPDSSGVQVESPRIITLPKKDASPSAGDSVARAEGQPAERAVAPVQIQADQQTVTVDDISKLSPMYYREWRDSVGAEVEPLQRRFAETVDLDKLNALAQVASDEAIRAQETARTQQTESAIQNAVDAAGKLQFFNETLAFKRTQAGGFRKPTEAEQAESNARREQQGPQQPPADVPAQPRKEPNEKEEVQRAEEVLTPAAGAPVAPAVVPPAVAPKAETPAVRKPDYGQTPEISALLTADTKADTRLIEPGITEAAEPNSIVVQLRDLQSRPVRVVTMPANGDPLSDSKAIESVLRNYSENSGTSIRESSAVTTGPNGRAVYHFGMSPNGMAWTPAHYLIAEREKAKAAPVTPSAPPSGRSLRGKKEKPAELPEELRRGEWIEYTDDEGKTQQARVYSIVKVGRVAPGITEKPRVEYMMEDANGQYMPSPKEGTPVKKIAAPVETKTPVPETKPAEDGTKAPVSGTVDDATQRLWLEGKIVDELDQKELRRHWLRLGGVPSKVKAAVTGKDLEAGVLNQIRFAIEQKAQPEWYSGKAATKPPEPPTKEPDAPSKPTLEYTPIPSLTSRASTDSEARRGKEDFMAFAGSNEGGFLSVDGTGKTDIEARQNAIAEFQKQWLARKSRQVAPVEKPPTEIKSPIANLTPEEQAELEELERQLNQKLGGTYTGIDPEIAVIASKMANLYAKGGIRTFDQFARNVKDRLPGIWARLKTYLRAAWNQIADMMNFAEVSRAEAESVFAALDKPADKPTVEKEANERTLDQRTGSAQGDDVTPVGSEGGPSGLPRSGRVGSDQSETSEGMGGGRKPATASGGSEQPSGGGEPAGAGGRSDTPSAPRNKRALRGAESKALAAKNYVITDADNLGKGSLKAKATDNLNAIRLVKKLEQEDRLPTEEEKRVLVKYVGWGGLKNVFNPESTQFVQEYSELKKLLTDEEYERARSSIQDAHYTSQTIIQRGVYAAMKRFGFPGGKMVEGGVGFGHFIGLMPEEMRGITSYIGIERDPLTAKIAQYLYPESKIYTKGYQEADMARDSFDGGVGNPPFGKKAIYDKRFTESSKFSIHNYFIAKTLELIRPGGVAGFVVSRYFLDNADPSARQYIAGLGEFLGAIRLPNTAFKENANTDVVTDLVFFKRLPEGAESNTDWTEVTPYKDEASGLTWKVNKWIVEHPEMVLGKITKAERGLYSKEELTVAPNEGQDLGADLDAAVANLPADVYERTSAKAAERLTTPAAVPDGTKVGAFYTTTSGLFRRLQDVNGESQFVKVEMKDGTAERVTAIIPIRNALNALIRSELSKDSTDAEIAANQATLNRVYDSFVKKYGFLNSATNRRAFYDDADAMRVLGLEKDYLAGLSKATAKKKGVDAIPATAKKADIFTTRVNVPYQEVTSVDTPKEALAVSLNQRGMVDLDYMAGLVNMKPEAVLKDLGGLVFKTPLGGYESKEQYLSGNVREKLAAAEGAGLTENIEALKAVIPKDIEATDIIAPIGAPWIDAKDVSLFAKTLTDSAPSVVLYLKANAGWSFEHRDRSTASVQKWGTPRMPFGEMMKLILNGKPVVVYDFIPDGNGGEQRVVNQQETELANAKAAELKDKWQEWIWSDKERRERLHRIYNDTFNNYVDFTADGSHLTLPGASTVKALRTHQKNVVWRTITNGGSGLLYDHVVGAGKTIAAVASMMELKRLGRVHKWLVAVPNHLTGQWADAFTELYPNGNILAAKPSDFTKENRQKLFAKILTGDYDAVILGHSNLKKIGTSPEVEKSILQEMMKEIVDTIKAMKDAEGSAGRKGGSRQVAQMERTKDNIQAKIDKLAHIGGRDTVAMFEELGFDGLLVDEAHEFKNLYYTTQMQNVAGLGNPAGSQKAFDLYLKTRYLRNQYGGNAPIVFLTGTPISNSLVEMFTMQRYLQPGVLESMGLKTLDAWAKVFADIRAVYEVDPTGTGYRMATRLANFQNVGELTAIYRNMADVISMNDLQAQAEAAGNRFPVPKLKGGKPNNIVAERTPEQAAYFGVETQQLDSEGKPQFDTNGDPVVAYPEGTILYRVDNMPDDPKVDNMLKLTNDARRAGLDMRLINPGSPDRPTSKVNLAVNEIVRIHKQWTPQRGTQLVFCDLSVPASARGKATTKAKTGGAGYYIQIRNTGELQPVEGEAVKFDRFPEYEFFVRKAESGKWIISERTSGLGIGAAGKTKAEAIANGQRIITGLKAEMLAEQIAQSQPSPEALQDLASKTQEVEKVVEDDAVEEGEQGVSADDILADQSSFSVYDDMRAKLLKAGIPNDQIAFIHDYDTPEKKQKLFKQVNEGIIRVLFGSTAKMGAGMNVQRRVVAIHHMDAPWRPSDLEQRNGRVIRQDNLFYEEAIKQYANPQEYDKDEGAFSIEENRYATGLSYDTRMWQLIEHKAAGIEGFRKADRSTRKIDDIGGEAANASDMKAAASGDPMIQQELQLRNDLNRLQLLKKAWDRNRIELQNREAYLAGYEQRYQSRVDELNARKAMLEKNTPVDDKGKEVFEFVLPDGNKVDEKGTALGYAAGEIKEGKRGYWGKYRGQDFSFSGWTIGDVKGVTFYASKGEFSTSKVVTQFTGDEKMTGVGLFQRLDNYLDVAESDFAQAERLRDKEKATLDEVKLEATKVFPKDKELSETRQKHESVRSQLMNKKRQKVAPAKAPDAPLPLEGWDMAEEGDQERDGTYDELLKGNPDVDTVLAALEANARNEFERALIRKLRALGLKTRVRLAPQSEAATITSPPKPNAGGLYFRDADEVVIFDGAVNQHHALLHELLHAATHQAIDQDTAYLAELEAMLGEARAALGMGDYGLTNVHEFVVEAFGNPAFQARLKGVKSGSRTLWQKFMAWLRRLFGVADQTLLERLVERVEDEMRAPEGGEGGPINTDLALDEDELPRAQVGGIPKIGQRRATENIAEIQAAVRTVFDGRDQVTAENTAKAWDILGAMTDPTRRGASAQEFKNQFGGTDMSLGLFQGELRNYALKLAAVGDRSLFVEMLNHSADFETLTGGGDTAAARALRAAKEFASSPAMSALEEVLTTERLKAAAQGLELTEDNFARLMRALDDFVLPEEELTRAAEKAADEASPDPTDADQAAMRKAAKLKAVGGLVRELRKTPRRTQLDPLWRRGVAERWFKSAGLTDEQAARAADLFNQEFEAAMAKAQERLIRQELKGKPETINDVIAAIRAGILTPDSNWVDEFAENAGWRRPTDQELADLVDLDAQAGDPALSPAEVAAVHEQMMRIVRHLGKHEDGFMKAMAERFVGGLLSGVRTFTIQFAPTILALRDLAIASLSDPKNAKSFATAMYNAARANFTAEAKFAWQNNAYKFHLGELDLTHGQLDRIWAEAEEQYRTGGPGMKAWARLRQLYAINRFVFKVLNTLDNTMMGATRDWKLAYYGSIAFKEAGLNTEQIGGLVDAMALARQAAYDAAIADGLDDTTAQVRANHEVLQAVQDFVADRTGDETLAAQVLEAAEMDAYSMVGRQADGISESDEGMLSRLLPNDFMEWMSKLRSQGGTKALIGTALFGFVNIPYRAARFASTFHPYGLLRYGINKYRTARGKEQWWKQSYGNALQARARFREAMSGTVVMLLAMAWAASHASSDDDAGDDEASLYITGGGPKNKNLRDAWTKRGFRPYALNFVFGGRVVSIPITRIGEMIMFPLMIPAAMDDAAWRKKEAQVAGKTVSPFKLFAATAIGTQMAMMGQKGVFQTVTKLNESMQGGDSFVKASAKLGAGVGSALALPLKQLLASFSSMFVGPLDQSSAGAIIAANLPIVGLPWQNKAINRFGDQIGDRSWYGRLADTGIPIAFQVERAPDSERLYTTLVSKGIAPPELRRYVLEERYGPLTDDQYASFAQRSGEYLRRQTVGNLSELSDMTPEEGKKWLTKAAGQADRLAATGLGLERVETPQERSGGSGPTSGRQSRSAVAAITSLPRLVGSPIRRPSGGSLRLPSRRRSLRLARPRASRSLRRRGSLRLGRGLRLATGRSLRVRPRRYV